jgi:hypothetical protein
MVLKGQDLRFLPFFCYIGYGDKGKPGKRHIGQIRFVEFCLSVYNELKNQLE